MITNFHEKNRKDDIKILSTIIAIFLFVVWLCTPPGNKFAQVCFYGNNTQFLIAKLTKTKEELNEWIYHRNNAVYLARMERKEASLTEMNQAVRTVPNFISEQELSNLYSDRGDLRLFWGENKQALDDFLRVNNPNITDRFKIALLYKEIGNNKYALSYCNSIINQDSSAYVGYACIADVYAGVGKFDTAIRVYDLLIDKKPNRARYYADRAQYKNLNGDTEGYKADMQKAKDLSPMIAPNPTIFEDTLRPKKLKLAII